MSGRPWTKRELTILRASYGKKSSHEIARKLGRTWSSTVQRARILGLSKTNLGRGPERESVLRKMHAEGFSDADIGVTLKVNRTQISEWRRLLGLPSNAHNERHRAKTRARMERQCKKWGVANLGELRSKVWSQKVAAAGWPSDLSSRAATILNALWDNGPMTRREICEAIGLPWKGSRHSLKDTHVEGGCYMACLMHRGLVVRLGRVVRNSGKGSNCYLYSLPFDLEKE